MPNNDSIPSKASLLADLVTGQAGLSQAGATVQRSHRFPLHLFVQIEKLAQMGGVPASLIINELLAIGLEAVIKELPENAALEAKQISGAQINGPTKTKRVEVKPKSQVGKPKLPRAK